MTSRGVPGHARTGTGSAPGAMVIGEVLPMAVVIAVSPFTVIPAVFMQFTPRAKVTSGAFLAGWVIGVAVPAVLCAVLTSLVPLGERDRPWTDWARIVLGLCLVALGVRQWLVRHGKPAPRWMRLLSEAGPGRAFRLGVLLAVANPKIFLLSAAAGLAVGAAGSSAAGAGVGLAVFTAVAASTVALPVLLHTVGGPRVLGPLARVKLWLETHAAAVMAWVIVAIGVLLLAEGLAGAVQGVS
ncbi:GAP family protein [Streptomyces sp. Isolate_45]|uniref:GAP family protein n=1 Tax=Streptomyces sp. Isolate_45 TaxID=2950111 RepID=UPI002481E340|nr:GAP family protein [Streptomyces sp. Isolate_45]MDA5286110.1 GAP family protein [Streptomyces sp. Isolate_45]